MVKDDIELWRYTTFSKNFIFRFTEIIFTISFCAVWFIITKNAPGTFQWRTCMFENLLRDGTTLQLLARKLVEVKSHHFPLYQSDRFINQWKEFKYAPRNSF